MENRMSAKFDELKTSVETYITASEAALAAAQANVQTAIDTAIAAHDAGEEDAFGGLKDEVDAAFMQIGAVPAPVMPPAEPTP